MSFITSNRFTLGRLSIILWLAFTVLDLCATQSALAGSTFRAKPQWKFVEKKLKANGFAPSFIRALKGVYSPEDFSEVLRLNTLLFLKKTDYHGPQVDAQARDEVQEYLEKHKSIFQKVEKQYGVDRSVVASLLWMESRLGRNQGQFHVPSVYADMLQVNRRDIRNDLYIAALEYGPLSKKDRGEIAKRAKKKEKWALEQLQALAKIYKSNKTILKDMTGSFSGAFGLPQFLPSSYLTYGRAFAKKKIPNLYSNEDAIQSVAYYLKASGWRAGKPKTHEAALFKYNNSHDYAAAILDLSNRARQPANRR